jgi:hypothetical protein
LTITTVGWTNVTGPVLALSAPAVAVTVTAPLTVLVRTAVAAPLALVGVVDERAPPVVEKLTGVPAATGVPSAFRYVAVTATGVFTGGDGGE